jgi:uncharacterized membrane protein YGL010W
MIVRTLEHTTTLMQQRVLSTISTLIRRDVISAERLSQSRLLSLLFTLFRTRLANPHDPVHEHLLELFVALASHWYEDFSSLSQFYHVIRQVSVNHLQLF